MSQIESAIAVAVDQYDLAQRLAPVLEAATALAEIEAATIESTVSVAQSSFDYWNVQYPAFEQEYIAEYGPCAESRTLEGYSFEDARTSCLGATETFQTRWSFPTAPPSTSVLARRSLTNRMCGPGLGAGFRKIVAADAKGAWSGGISGGVAAGLQGAILGALVGGGSASIWAAGENAWETLRCQLQR